MYFRGGNSSDEMITVVLFRDGEPMRYFPIAAKGATHVALRVVEDLLGDTVLELFVAAPERMHAAPSSSTSAWWRSDMAPQKLVVVGNGMAGVRAIEEILARGGGEKFDITVFGDEPYGNYNRILLSMCWPAVRRADARSISMRWTGTPTTTSTCGPGYGWCASTDSLIWCTPTTARSFATTS